MKKVYVAGAISANNLEGGLRNLRQGILMGAELLKMGFAPFVPHLDHQYCLVQDDHIPVETFYNYDLEWLKVCDYILVLPNSENSKGVKEEIATAEMLGIPICTSIPELVHYTCMEFNNDLNADNIKHFMATGADLLRE